MGSGGREHALALGLSKGRDMETLYIAPGNPGTEQLGTNVKLDMGDFQQVEAFVLEKGIDMIVVGPEAPLVAGIADHFKKHSHIQVIGPSSQGAQLEGSKAFSKKFMQYSFSISIRKSAQQSVPSAFIAHYAFYLTS